MIRGKRYIGNIYQMKNILPCTQKISNVIYVVYLSFALLVGATYEVTLAVALQLSKTLEVSDTTTSTAQPVDVGGNTCSVQPANKVCSCWID